MLKRNLDYPPDLPVSELGAAALDDLLERGGFDDWGPLAREIRREPFGRVAETILNLSRTHPLYGTSNLWRTWIHGLRGGKPGASWLPRLRRRAGLTQEAVASRLGISQSDTSKLERRGDVRLSTLRAYVEATGGRLLLTVVYIDGQVELEDRP